MSSHPSAVNDSAAQDQPSPLSVKPASNSVSAVVNALKDMFGERCSTSDAVRLAHGKGESWHPPELPDCVCYPDTTQEVSQIMVLCHQHKVPVIPFLSLIHI